MSQLPKLENKNEIMIYDGAHCIRYTISIIINNDYECQVSVVVT